jgi:hypothetical protein
MSFILNEDEYTDQIRSSIMAKFGQEPAISKYLLNDLQTASKWLNTGNESQLERGLGLIQTIQDIVDGKKGITDSQSYRNTNKITSPKAVAGKGSLPKAPDPDKFTKKTSYTNTASEENERNYIKDTIKQGMRTVREVNPDYVRSKLEASSVDTFDQEYTEILNTLTTALEKFDTIPTPELQKLRKDIVDNVNNGLRKKAEEVKRGKLNIWTKGRFSTKAKELNKELSKMGAVDATDFDAYADNDDIDKSLGLTTNPDQFDADAELDALASDRRTALREKINDLFNLLDEDEEPLDFGDVEDTFVPDNQSNVISKNIPTFNWKAIEIPYEDQKDREVKNENLNKNLSQETRNIKLELNRVLQDEKTIRKLAKEFIDNIRPNKRMPTLSLANSKYDEIQKMPLLQKYDEFIKYIIGLIYVKYFNNPSVPMNYLKSKGLNDENIVVPQYIAFRILDAMRGTEGYNALGKIFMEIMFPTGQA